MFRYVLLSGNDKLEREKKNLFPFQLRQHDNELDTCLRCMKDNNSSI